MEELDLELVDEEDYSIRHSTSDPRWLFKKWFLFITPILILNFGLMALVVLFRGLAIWISIIAITLSHIRDLIYILISIYARIFRKKKVNWGKRVELKPNQSVQIGCIVTCYTERFETVLETVRCLYDSAAACDTIDIKPILICVCDGQLIGRENDRPLGDLFLNKMKQTRKPLVRQYKTWRKEKTTAVIHYGTLDGNSFMLIRKMKNRGKKDGLILATSIIHDINAGLGPYKTLKIADQIKYTHATDADTMTDIHCIGNSVKNMELYPEVDAAVNLLRVRFHDKTGDINYWNYFRNCSWEYLQHFQYFSR